MENRPGNPVPRPFDPERERRFTDYQETISLYRSREGLPGIGLDAIREMFEAEDAKNSDARERKLMRKDWAAAMASLGTAFTVGPVVFHVVQQFYGTSLPFFAFVLVVWIMLTIYYAIMRLTKWRILELNAKLMWPARIFIIACTIFSFVWYGYFLYTWFKTNPSPIVSSTPLPKTSPQPQARTSTEQERTDYGRESYREFR